MHDGALGQRCVLGVAVAPVLRHGVFDGLTCEVVLQLGRRRRDAIDQKRQVKGLVRSGLVGELPGDGDTIRRVASLQFRREPEGGGAETRAG